MNTKTRLAVLLGVVSILFSTFCLIVMPVFLAAIMAAPLLGIAVGAVALFLDARRTAVVTFAFALVPLCGLLAMETLAKHVGTGYVAFAPLAAAAALAAWATASYSREQRAQRGAAA